MIVAIVVNDGIEAHGDIRVLFPHVSFPPSGPEEQWLEDNNIKPVTYWKSHDLLTEKLVPCDPYLEDGEVYAVEVEPYTEEELEARNQSQWAKVRVQRNKLLADTDWVVLKALEASTAVTQVWMGYRQALRDITEQEDPFNIVWPELPSE